MAYGLRWPIKAHGFAGLGNSYAKLVMHPTRPQASSEIASGPVRRNLGINRQARAYNPVARQPPARQNTPAAIVPELMMDGTKLDGKTRLRRIVFTLNNWTQEEYDWLTTTLPTLPQPKVTWMIVGKEVAPETGTPHLQGMHLLFVNFTKVI